MRTIRNLRHRTLVALVFAAVGSIVALSAVLVIASDQGDAELPGAIVTETELPGALIAQPELPEAFIAEAERQGAFIGEARRSGDSTIVAYINGHPVTAADIAEQRAEAAVGLEAMRSTIARIIPDSEAPPLVLDPPLAPGEVRSISGSSMPIFESSGIREFYQAQINLVNQHGVDSSVFGSIVLDRALFTAASAAGHTADPAEIAAEIAQIKTLLADGLLPKLSGYLTAVDEEEFFSEIIPDRLARQHVIASWREELLSEVTSLEDANRVWRNLERNAILGSQVTITNQSDLDTTIERATMYLEAYWALAALNSPGQPLHLCDLAVPNQADNPRLDGDCMTLLGAKDTLRGTGSLNWSADTAMGSWDGVTTGGTPAQVTKVELPSKSLTGSIPAVLGRLFDPTHLDLSNNALTGDIPAELGWLHNLQEIRLSGNSLTGCIPLALRDVATNDFSSLSLPYCRLPAPAAPTAGTAGESSVPLTWTAATNVSKYRVEQQESGPGYWTVADDTIAGTNHTVDGLLCGTTYEFRLSAYGDGTAYEAAWSDPSTTLEATTAACMGGR